MGNELEQNKRIISQRTILLGTDGGDDGKKEIHLQTITISSSDHSVTKQQFTNEPRGEAGRNLFCGSPKAPTLDRE